MGMTHNLAVNNQHHCRCIGSIKTITASTNQKIYVIARNSKHGATQRTCRLRPKLGSRGIGIIVITIAIA